MTENEIGEALERAFANWRRSYNAEHAAKMVGDDAMAYALRATLWSAAAKEVLRIR